MSKLILSLMLRTWKIRYNYLPVSQPPDISAHLLKANAEGYRNFSDSGNNGETNRFKLL